MKIAGSRILLTGASGGIGRCLSLELCRRGARLGLVGRDRVRLDAVAREIAEAGGKAWSLPFDLQDPEGHAELVARAIETMGDIDALINNAGELHLTAFTDEDEASLRRLIAVNLTAPLLLSRAVLPHLLHRGTGAIVNVGSAFGAIGFPYYAAYSASKFGLRGFSEALRREIADTGIEIVHVAPRATLTSMNGPTARAFMSETGTPIDSPEKVAAAIADALANGRKETGIGAAERFFARLNGVLPELVDGALVKQGRIAARHLDAMKADK